MEKLEVIVKGSTGVGKSHVMAIIERALMQEYGHEVKITSEDLRAERNLVGEDIRNWTSLDGSKVEIVIKEQNVPRRVDTSLAITALQFDSSMDHLKANRDVINALLRMQVVSVGGEDTGGSISVVFNDTDTADRDAIRQALYGINQVVLDSTRDLDYHYVLYRTDIDGKVIQATLLPVPLIEVRIFAGMIQLTFNCKSQSGGPILKEFCQRINAATKLGNVIKMTNEYMVRTIRE
jgi:energy-coupling factor transporter ATP-binding protein EcfA2